MTDVDSSAGEGATAATAGGGLVSELRGRGGEGAYPVPSLRAAKRGALSQAMAGDTAQALVVLADGPHTAALYLEPRTCLSHLEALARFVGRDISIAMTHGHTEAIWRGRGQR